MDYNLLTSKSHCIVPEKYSIFSKDEKDSRTTEQSNAEATKPENSPGSPSSLGTKDKDGEPGVTGDQVPQDLRKVPVVCSSPRSGFQDTKKTSQHGSGDDDSTRKTSSVTRSDKNCQDKATDSDSSKGGDSDAGGTTQKEQAKYTSFHPSLASQLNVKHLNQEEFEKLKAQVAESDLKGNWGDTEFLVEEKPLECKECGKTFTYRSHLVIHERTHTGERLYGCDECGKKFLARAHLLRHQITHTGERPYICSLCTKGFNSSCNLSAHLKTHTGERSHLCLVCGKTFINSTALTIHERTHTGEKPYICLDCGKAFAIRPSLIIHQRSHTGERPYVCTQCGKRFACSSNLLAHSKIHTGERPYSCEECGFSFYTRSHLVRHRYTHVGGGPYICSECGRSFESMPSLARHKKLHTKGQRTEEGVQ